MAKTKPLTEGGSLGFNGSASAGKLRKTISDYRTSLESFYLGKELNEFTSRFKWTGLPDNMNADLLETMLYIKGQVCLFKVAEVYYILPFVYTGQINQYGIHTKLLPISFSGKLDNDSNGKNNFASEKEAVLYPRDLSAYAKDDIAVVVRSSSGIYSSITVPPIVMTTEIRDKLIENLILVRNNIILSQPIKFVQAANEAQGKQLMLEVDNLLHDILNGNVVQVLTGLLEMKEIDTKPTQMKPQDLWQSYSSLDNLRMEYMGILNNGVFEKKERFLSDEVSGKQSVSKLLLQNSLNRRKEFCQLAKQVFGLNITVEIDQTMTPPEEKEPADHRAIGGNEDVNV